MSKNSKSSRVRASKGCEQPRRYVVMETSGACADMVFLWAGGKPCTFSEAVSLYVEKPTYKIFRLVPASAPSKQKRIRR